ncbi:MAG: DUF3187 family protein [Pseudobacteriovorax sp.]|nr:DUF3187 family protein [Pseudobacteriovorax sp.]
MHFILVFFTVLILATEAVGQSVLFVRSQTLAQFFRLPPNPHSTEITPKMEATYQVAKTWSNYWGYDKRFVVDGQTSENSMQIKYGLPSHFEFVFEAHQREFSDVAMDEIAIRFHEIFHIPQDQRTKLETNKTQFSIPDFGLNIGEEDIGKKISTPVGLKLVKHFQSPDEQLRWFTAILWGGETSSQALRPRSFEDRGIQVGLSYPVATGEFLANGNYMIFKEMEDSQLYLKDRQWSLLLAYSIPYLGLRWHSQMQATESPFVNIGQLSEISYEIHWGITKIWGQWFGQFTILENVFWPFNTPDWGVSIALGSHRL